jgi:hypothetical protein
VQLTKGPDGFEQTVRVPWDSTVTFKYVVDGRWVTSDDHALARDASGNVNNVIHTPPKPVAPELDAPLAAGVALSGGAFRPSLELPAAPSMASSFMHAIADGVQHGVESVQRGVESVSHAAQAFGDQFVDPLSPPLEKDQAASMGAVSTQAAPNGVADAAQAFAGQFVDPVSPAAEKEQEPAAAVPSGIADVSNAMQLFAKMLVNPVSPAAAEEDLPPAIPSAEAVADEAKRVAAAAQAIAERGVASTKATIAKGPKVVGAGKTKAAEATNAVREAVVNLPTPSAPATAPAADSPAPAAEKTATPSGKAMPILSLGHPIESGAAPVQTTVVPGAATADGGPAEQASTHAPVNLAGVRRNSTTNPPNVVSPLETPAPTEATKAETHETNNTAQDVASELPPPVEAAPVAESPAAAAIPAQKPATPSAKSMPILSLGHPIENGNGAAVTNGNAAEQVSTHAPVNLAASRKNSSAVAPTVSPPVTQDVVPEPSAESTAGAEPTAVSPPPAAEPAPAALDAEPAAAPLPPSAEPAIPTEKPATSPGISMPILSLGHPIENGTAPVQTDVVPGAATANGAAAEEVSTHAPVNLAAARKNSSAAPPATETAASATPVASPTASTLASVTSNGSGKAARPTSMPQASTPSTPVKNGSAFSPTQGPGTPNSTRSMSSSRFSTSTGKKRESIFGKVKDIFHRDKEPKTQDQDKSTDEKKMRRFSSLRGKP